MRRARRVIRTVGLRRIIRVNEMINVARVTKSANSH